MLYKPWAWYPTAEHSEMSPRSSSLSFPRRRAEMAETPHFHIEIKPVLFSKLAWQSLLLAFRSRRFISFAAGGNGASAFGGYITFEGVINFVHRGCGRERKFGLFVLKMAERSLQKQTPHFLRRGALLRRK